MSAEANAWAWQQTPNSGAKLVLLCLADQSDPQGRAQATSKEIADKTSLTQSTIFRHLAELQEGELLTSTKQRGKGSKQAPNLYQLSLSRVRESDKSRLSGSYSGNAVESQDNSLLESESGATEKKEPSTPKKERENNTTWSDGDNWTESYSLLHGIKGFEVDIESYLEWVKMRKLPEEFLVKTAYALRDWWARSPKAQKRGNPYFTFQNWCVRDAPGGSETPNTSGLKEGWANG